ncbi:DUF1707 domain-containing protein [Pseudonocardia sp. MH-G8]|uniref:DUF1707 SHOCT-like domain-containing protein n=1 Tax=Pseudonocardia sp. MH-G8 TaxID=1854588 RepID=UPI000BA16205|nr:DUF1707 domain-containing protein [Pseudonocardia sp. MH-G8]OZM82321.1 hypothetical protein CFP66_11185 [Pseudonocardia sp. MH-G8]
MSESPSSPEPRGIRISDADREKAAQQLHQALAEGRITLSELEERLAVVYAARYEADLRPPLADLPGADVVAGAAVVEVPSDAPPVVLRAGMSTIKRSGAWDVPARLQVHSAMGSVVLDFCDATIRYPVIDIEVDLGAGSAKLLLPDEATANVDDVVAGMGTVKSSVPSVRRPGVPHFVLHGRAGMGSVTVRRRYRIAGRYF